MGCSDASENHTTNAVLPSSFPGGASGNGPLKRDYWNKPRRTPRFGSVGWRKLGSPYRPSSVSPYGLPPSPRGRLFSEGPELHTPVHTEQGQVDTQQERHGEDSQADGNARLQQGQQSCGGYVHLVIEILRNDGERFFQIAGIELHPIC